MEDSKRHSRREFLLQGLRAAGLVAAAGTLGALGARAAPTKWVWQIDPDRCTACGKCATACVLTPSAVKCIHEVERCGYCALCFGYFRDQRAGDETTAENERCPTRAIQRVLIEGPYHEYTVDESLCIGCARCVEGCSAFGNGSLIMQVRHDRCLNCNDCPLARVCPPQAFVRVPADQPELPRHKWRAG